MKVAVYTSITAAKDSLKEPCVRGASDFLLFSSDPTRAVPGWDVRAACDLFTDPRRNSRAPKILAHQYLPDYDYSLWIDGSIRLLASPLDLIANFLGDTDIALFRHSLRDCVYEEAAVCTELKLEDAGIIAAQMSRYRGVGHPAHGGLCENGVILRRHSARVEAFNNAWWAEFCRHACRDQLSINYVLGACGVRPAFFPGTIYDNPGIAAHEGHLR